MRHAERLALLAAVIALTAAIALDRVGTRAVADPAQPAAVKVATVDVYELINVMLNTPERVAKRDETVKYWNERLTSLEKDITTMQATLKVLPRQDPEYPKVEAQLGAKINEMQQARQEGMSKVELSQSAQLIEIYGIVTQAAAAAAAELGYSHLICTRSMTASIDPKTQDTVLQEILARPVLASPPTDDITPNVKTKLGL